MHRHPDRAWSVPFGGSRATDPSECQTYLRVQQCADPSGHLDRTAFRDDGPVRDAQQLALGNRLISNDGAFEPFAGLWAFRDGGCELAAGQRLSDPELPPGSLQMFTEQFYLLSNKEFLNEGVMGDGWLETRRYPGGDGLAARRDADPGRGPQL